MEQLPAYLTIEEVAARYRAEVSTMRYWRQIGVGPRAVHAHGAKGRLLYPAAEIRRYDEELLQQAAYEPGPVPGTTRTPRRASRPGRGPVKVRRLAPAAAETASR